MSRFERPGRRPGVSRSGQRALVLAVVGAAIGLGLLRSATNVSIMQMSAMRADLERRVAADERELDWERVDVERLRSLEQIEPRARAAGFVHPDGAGLQLLTAAATLPSMPGARPLGLPGADALGRWLRRAAAATAIAPAAAAPELAPPFETVRRTASERHRAGAAAEPSDAPNQALSVGEHGEREARCEVCRALAAGHAPAH